MNSKEFDKTDKDAMLPLAEFVFKANFTKTGVWLWNAIWGVLSLLVAIVAISIIFKNGLSVGRLLSFFAASWFAWISLKVSFSVWKSNICIYEDRLRLCGAAGDKIIEYKNTYLRYHCPSFAGGWVLDLTERIPNNLLSRLNQYLLLNNIMVIHLYLLSDNDHQALVNLISKLSGRPESEIRFARTFVPFYPNKEEVFNAPTKIGTRNGVIIIGIISYVLLFLLWLVSESSKAHIGIFVMAIIMPFVLVFGYAFGDAEVERYKEIQKKDRQPKV